MTPPRPSGRWTAARVRAAAFAVCAPFACFALLHQTFIALLPRLEPPPRVWYAFDGGTEADHEDGSLFCWTLEHVATEPLGALDGRYELHAARVHDFSPSLNGDGSLSLIPRRPPDGFERASALLRLDRAATWSYRATGRNTTEGWREFRRTP